MTLTMCITTSLLWKNGITAAMVCRRFRLFDEVAPTTHKHWAWIPRDTLDQVIVRIHIGSVSLSIENGRRGRRVGPPKFKRKGRSAKFQTGYKIFEQRPDGKPSEVPKGTIRLSFKEWCPDKQKFVFKRRNILYHPHRDWKGNVRIGRDSVGTFWLYVVTDDSTKEVLPATGKSVGVDFGRPI